MAPSIEIQIAVDSDDDIPDSCRLRAWAEAALADAAVAGVVDAGADLTVRVVDEAEGRDLNHGFRGRDYATNVLSFPSGDLPAEAAAELGAAYLGDLAICAPVVAREAAEQRKAPEAHWAHMVVHGVLHLAGYDHLDDAEAETMEHHERRILARLGIDDPYRVKQEGMPEGHAHG